MPRSLSLLERVENKILVSDSGCWMWLGANDRHGYGHIKVARRLLRAHRVAYELYVGPIPDGLVIDHLCRVRACVNPEHMEPVTSGENTRRSPWNSAERCCRGHVRTAANTSDRGTGRRCLDCHKAASDRYRLSQSA